MDPDLSLPQAEGELMLLSSASSDLFLSALKCQVLRGQPSSSVGLKDFGPVGC